MSSATSLAVAELDTTEERGGDVPPVGFDPSCMSVVSIRDLAAGTQAESGANDKLIVQWVESLVVKAVNVRKLFGGCPAATARFLVGPAERQAKEAIEFISDPSRREELMSRLRKVS